jgi:hypothetical protein
MALKTLLVFANPYGQLDHEGRPACAVQYEPDVINGDASLRYVGAVRSATEIAAAKPALGILAQHDLTWEFSTEPTVVASTHYYHSALRHGDLVAANPETWKAAGLPADAYVDPKIKLARNKAAAIANWQAHYGEDPSATVEHWGDFHGSPAAATKAALRFTAPTAAAVKE